MTRRISFPCVWNTRRLCYPRVKRRKEGRFHEVSLLTRGRNHRDCPLGGNPRHGLSGKSLKSFCSRADLVTSKRWTSLWLFACYSISLHLPSLFALSRETIARQRQRNLFLSSVYTRIINPRPILYYLLRVQGYNWKIKKLRATRIRKFVK